MWKDSLNQTHVGWSALTFGLLSFPFPRLSTLKCFELSLNLLAEIFSIYIHSLHTLKYFDLFVVFLQTIIKICYLYIFSMLFLMLFEILKKKKTTDHPSGNIHSTKHMLVDQS